MIYHVYDQLVSKIAPAITDRDTRRCVCAPDKVMPLVWYTCRPRRRFLNPGNECNLERVHACMYVAQ